MNQDNIRTALKSIARAFEERGIRWFLGGSCLLLFKGYDVDVNDIDIIVHKADRPALEAWLETWSTNEEMAKLHYRSEHFYQVQRFGVPMDLMIDFTVDAPEGTCRIAYDTDRVPEPFYLDDIAIPLGTVDEWRRAYTAMGRADKIALFET